MAGQRQLDTRTITAGALLAALALVLGLAAYYVPVVGEVMALVAPLPLTVAHLRYGFRTGVLAAIVASLLAAFVGGPLAAMFIAANCALGLALGYGMGRRWGAWRTIALASGVFFATAVASWGLVVYLLGAQSAVAGIAAMAVAFEQAAEAIRNLPGGGPSADAFVQLAGVFRTYPMHTLLFASITGGAMWSVMWYGVGAPILRRLGSDVPPAPRVAPVAVWHLPGYLGVACLLGLAAATFLGGRFLPGSAGLLLLQQALALVVLGFTLQGLGLWAHFITLAEPPPALRRAAIALAVLAGFSVPLAGQALMLAGMFDLALDIRGLYGTRGARRARKRSVETDSQRHHGLARSGGEEDSASVSESVDTRRPAEPGRESEFRRGKRQ
ncbi:MAG: DUF2232 domain-containing protein [Bacillota bacterium]|nr:DUF2232 domain-containing protein [Bacillota bacterium]